MFAITKLKEKYATAIGYTLFDEAGEVEHYYRQNYQIMSVVSGIFTTTPISMTAIRKPLIAVLNANITMAVPEERLIEVRDKLNSTAEKINGTSFTLPDTTDNSKTYSISYNAQTCTIGEKSIIGAGAGEYFPVYQSISYIIIEQGVSSYDAKIKIDNAEIPALTIVCNKIVTSNVLPDSNGIGKAICQQEVIGFDLTCPLLNDGVGEMLHKACISQTSNQAHYVEYTVGDQVKGYIMMFGNCTESVQPPSNIGFNISLVEVEPLIADFGTSLSNATYTGTFNKYTGRHYINKVVATQVMTGVVNSVPFMDMALLNNSTVSSTDKSIKYSVFWGDGTMDIFQDLSTVSNKYHYYQDGLTSHMIIIHTEEISNG